MVLRLQRLIRFSAQGSGSDWKLRPGLQLLIPGRVLTSRVGISVESKCEISCRLVPQRGQLSLYTRTKTDEKVRYTPSRGALTFSFCRSVSHGSLHGPCRLLPCPLLASNPLTAPHSILLASCLGCGTYQSAPNAGRPRHLCQPVGFISKWLGPIEKRPPSR